MKRLIYISYYGDPKADPQRKISIAAKGKVEYVAGEAVGLGLDTQVWSLCGVSERKGLIKAYPGYEREVNGFKVRFFKRYSSRFLPIRAVLRKISDAAAAGTILKELRPGDAVVLYHSQSALHLIRAFKRHGVRFALEAEEIYSDVSGKKRRRKRELAHMRAADGYILPTELLCSELEPGGKPVVIIHGTYHPEPDLGVKKFGSIPGSARVHCVYAGTFDPRKGGGEAAVRAAEYLPGDHHVHVIGFGTEKETEDIKRLISEVSAVSRAGVSYDGLFTGEDFSRFLQRCDIGLSTQDPSAAFNNTSFPSKILSYMANGLKVVSVRIPAIESSAVSSDIVFYDEQTPEEIAKAVMRADTEAGTDPRELIIRLADDFRRDLGQLLERL